MSDFSYAASICPYNSSHVVGKGKLIKHLLKCQRKYGHIVLEVCPYNATHRIHPDTFSEHINSCPQRRPIQNYKYFHSYYETSSETGLSVPGAMKEVGFSNENQDFREQLRNLFQEDSEEDDVIFMPESGPVPYFSARAGGPPLLPETIYLDWSKKLGMGRGKITL